MNKMPNSMFASLCARGSRSIMLVDVYMWVCMFFDVQYNDIVLITSCIYIFCSGHSVLFLPLSFCSRRVVSRNATARCRGIVVGVHVWPRGLTSACPLDLVTDWLACDQRTAGAACVRAWDHRQTNRCLSILACRFC